MLLFDKWGNEQEKIKSKNDQSLEIMYAVLFIMQKKKVRKYVKNSLGGVKDMERSHLICKIPHVKDVIFITLLKLGWNGNELQVQMSHENLYIPSI